METPKDTKERSIQIPLVLADLIWFFKLVFSSLYLSYRKWYWFGIRFRLSDAREAIKMKVDIFKYQYFLFKYIYKSPKSLGFKQYFFLIINK